MHFLPLFENKILEECPIRGGCIVQFKCQDSASWGVPSEFIYELYYEGTVVFSFVRFSVFLIIVICDYWKSRGPPGPDF